eukprot:Hpha_TRINITY_DN16648_c3_g6::TRINITY_DN16648_c3_g6_i1::g.183421::m.183421
MADIVGLIIPVKTTQALDFEKKVTMVGKLKGVHRPTLAQLTKVRGAAVKALAGGDHKVATDAVAEYLSLLAGTFPADEGGKAEQARAMCFFYWSQAFGPATSFAHSDTVYEGASLLANMAALDLRQAAVGLRDANQFNAEKMEGEAYRICCRAAGKYETAQRLMVKVDVQSAMPYDIRPEVLEGLKLLALGQAQECALAFSARKSDNRGRELLAKLASRALELYTDAARVFTPGRFPKEKSHEELAQWVQTRLEMIRALTAYYQCMFLCKSMKMEEALRVGDDAAAAAARALKLAGSKGPQAKYAKAVDILARQVQQKAITENDMFTHKRPSDAPVPTPPPQVLARPDAAWGPHGSPLPPPSEAWTDEVVAAFKA